MTRVGLYSRQIVALGMVCMKNNMENIMPMSYGFPISWYLMWDCLAKRLKGYVHQFYLNHVD